MAIARSLLLILFSLSVLTGPVALRAQEAATAPPATTPNGATDKDTAETDLPPLAADIVLRTETGELIPLRPLLGDSLIDEILLRGMEQTNVPRHTIAKQDLTASIDRDEVTLKLELQIQVRPHEEWVTIPMSFGDVFLKHFDHKSEAPNAQAVPKFGEQNSRQLHLFGSGLHTITLEMMGKARSPAPGVRQLSLNLLSATASHADIKFALPVELLTLPTGSVDRATRDDKGVRSVEFWGLAPTFHLAWSEVVQRVDQKPVIQVQNRMKLDLTTIPVNLTGTQQLQVSGSQVRELRVTFPEGFQLQEVDARNSNGISILNNFEITSAADSAKDSHAITALVRLTTATEGALTLSFDLELMNRTFPQDIRVTLPAIQDANVQLGDLDILFPTGLLVRQTVEGAQRKRVVSETDLNIAATAFRMRSMESYVVLHVEETEAQFAVSPELTLQPDAQNVILTARYPISVLTGALLDLSIYWPGYSSGEWQILPGTTRLVSGKTSSPLSLQQSDTETDVLQTTFRERQSGEFTVEFRAYAPLAAVRSGAIQLRCPEIQARLGQPVVLTTIESDEYSIRPISMGTGEPLPTIPLSAPAAAVNVGTGLKSESWLHDDAAIPIRLELPTQAPSVRANIRLGMQPRGTGIEVLETIDLEVEHRDLTSLSLSVPDGIRPTVQLAGQAEALRATIDSETHWSFRLPEARRGNLTFVVRYLWTPTVTTDSLPLILPESAEVLSIEAGMGSGTGLNVLDAPDWQPVYSEEFDAAWYTSKPVKFVPLRWQKSPELMSGDSPDLILTKTQILGNQRLTTTLALYEELPAIIEVETPINVGLPAILVDQQPLISEEAVERGEIRWEKIVERDLIRWTVRTPVPPSTKTESSPHVVECRIRVRVPQQSSLWQNVTLDRAVFVGEASAVPVIWYTGSQRDFQTAGASAGFISLEKSGSDLLPWNKSARSILDRQLKAILSPYPQKLQMATMDELDDWISLSDQHDLFFGSADSGSLKLTLVPFVSLLLVSAGVCVFVFIVLSILRQVTVFVPLFLIICTALMSWLMVPEWTALLAPYVAMGVVFGAVSVVFQRLISDKRIRFPKASQTGDYPTIFGLSGMLSNVGTERTEPDAAIPGTKSEFNVSSFV
jgi:hypothetical protein